MVGGINMPEINDSLQQIIECIKQKKNFILEAGAGSGKTWSLIESLKYIIGQYSDELEKNKKKIVCITYTNVAKDEITDRINHSPFVEVGTIHDFLWSVISPFTVDLKKVILAYNSELKTDKKIENLEAELSKIDKIEYSQYGKNLANGRITHEDVIELSSRLFVHCPKISQIFVDKYPFVFVDEYQDTEPRTKDLLLQNIYTNHKGKIVIGFFGDYMQKIYNQGVGKIEDDSLTVITKHDNFRCSKKVIDLLNHIRTNLTQVPSGHNKEGEISFYINGTSSGDVDKLLGILEAKGWNLSSTKTLFLTHKGIAEKLGYSNLLENYTKNNYGKELFLNKDDVFSQTADKIENLVFSYINKQYGDFIHLLGIENFKLHNHKDKVMIQELMNQLIQTRENKTIGETFDYAFQNKLIIEPTKIIDYSKDIAADVLDEKAQKKKRFYDTLIATPYKEVISIFKYIEDKTPFSTKHGVKGAEYENVLVVVDDNAWNQYKDDEVFSNDNRKQDRYNRTLNLLYMCCSRAKDKLALIAISALSRTSQTTINNWFGEENIYDISNL